jgi:hypothetical protein
MEDDDEWPTEADIEEMEVEAAIERAEWACVICGDDLRDCGHDQTERLRHDG